MRAAGGVIVPDANVAGDLPKVGSGSGGADGGEGGGA
jgi:hypothetical protein